MSSIGELSVSVTADASNLVSEMNKTRDELQQTTVVIQRQEAAWSELANSTIQAVGSATPAVLDFTTNIIKAFALRRIVTTAVAYATGIGVIGAAAGVTALAVYKLRGANDDATDSIGDAVPEYERLSQSYKTLKANVSDLGDSIAAPFRDGFSAVVAYVESFSPFPAIAGFAATQLNAVAEGIAGTSRWMREATATATTFAFILAGSADPNTAAAFYEQGQSLNAMAEASGKLTAKLESQRDGFKSLREIQESATRSAQQASEVARISTITTTEGIEAERQALQQRMAEAVRNGEADANWRKHAQALFDALERQNEGVKAGTIVDKEAEAAKRLAAQAAEEAARKQQQLNEQGIDRINRLRDEIDQLNGSATKAEIAMREMSRAGFSQEQIDEIGKLTDELDGLQQEARLAKEGGDATSGTSSKTRDQGGTAALLKGTSSAFSAIFAAGRRPDDRTAKASEGTLQEVKKLNNNILKLGNNGNGIVGGGRIGGAAS